ncbi:MAG: DoxX family protein [Candidatus Saccharibacteria bacterium]|nr:DoxX family protein [Candidatus Saccharibacteria bacterium]
MQDLSAGPLPANISREAAEKEMHVIDHDGKIYKNIDAVFKIVEEYPRLAWLARVGRWPGIKHVLSMGYTFVAKNRHVMSGAASRLYWTKFVLGISFISGILLSAPLWLSERRFPLSPLFAGLSIGYPYDFILAAGLLGALMAIIFSSQPRRYIYVLAGLLVVAALLDQMRWQPWVYQYGAMLLALSFFSWRASDKNVQPILNVCRLIVATIYIWSGLHKVNEAFIHDIFPWMLQPITSHLPVALHPYLQATGVMIPIVEMSIGIALLTSKFRNLAVLAAVGMHLSILALLGPFGQNWNSVVWPWNIAMILFNIILFWNIAPVHFRKLVWNRNFAYHGVVLVMFGLLPVFSLFGKWDNYLSSALYSGDIAKAVLTIRPEDSTTFHKNALSGSQSNQDGELAIPISSWSFTALNVPPYPEARVYKDIARQACQDGASSLKLVVERPQTIWQPGFIEQYGCAEL